MIVMTAVNMMVVAVLVTVAVAVVAVAPTAVAVVGTATASPRFGPENGAEPRGEIATPAAEAETSG
ncbi:hypothetical protein [Parafrankia soli]|nr:hypothetical protein [Parafrankia soli]